MFAKSNLEMNKEIARLDLWIATDIEARGARLADVALTLWSGPATIASLSLPQTGAKGDLNPDPDVWRDPLFLRRVWDESQTQMKNFLAYLANRPSQAIDLVELAGALRDGDRRQVAGTLGAFGFRTANRYRVATWPFVGAQNETSGLWEYTMPADIAEAIRAL